MLVISHDENQGRGRASPSKTTEIMKEACSAVFNERIHLLSRHSEG